jgi:undecaprenyl-diphosphatase
VFNNFLFNENFHTVIPGEVYRSAQPSPASLDRRIKKLGLRSIINLRTEENKAPWLEAESKVAETHGVNLYLVRLSVFMPPRATFRQLIHLLDTTRRPLLLHCEAGVDRSGIASAVAVLLAGGDVAEARKQFGLSYGFVPWLGSPDLPQVLDHYENWLTAQGWSHTPDRFKQWVENDYVPYFYRARLEPLEVPTSIVKGNSANLRFRAINISPQPWRFSSRQDRGIHFGVTMRPFAPGHGQEIELRGGFQDLTVAPGEAVVLELAIPPLESGRYRVLVDLVDEGKKWFSDMGSEPVIFELRIEDSNPATRNRKRGS